MNFYLVKEQFLTVIYEVKLSLGISTAYFECCRELVTSIHVIFVILGSAYYNVNVLDLNLTLVSISVISNSLISKSLQNLG